MSDGAVEPIGESFNLDPEYHKVSDFLGVNVYDRSDSELAKKVYALKDWALEKGKGKTTNDALWQIRSLQKELGHQFIGKPLITEMYKFIRLSADRKRESMPLESTTVKSPKPQEKPQVKVQGTIQKAVAETVNQSIKGMVNQALGDKKMIQGAVQNAIKEALK